MLLRIEMENFMSIKCELGFHDWGKAWLRKDSCEIQEQCSKCKAVRGPVVALHDWEWIQRTPHLSQQVCKRCSAIGQEIEKEHTWNVIYKPNSYEIQKTCELCGITETYSSGFSTFIGQDDIKQSLMTLVVAGRKKGETLHHILLCGQPGMGKVTLAKIVASEMGVNFKFISGNAIEKVGDFAAVLTNLRAGDFLIIEQIETLRKQILDVLVSAMTDFSLEIVIGKGSSARNIKLKLPHFTVVGTSSKLSQANKQLGNLMFSFNFNPYPKHEIGRIISLSARQQGIIIEDKASDLLADQSHGNLSEALLALKKVKEYAIAYSDGQITESIAKKTLAMFGSNNSNSPVFKRESIPDEVKIFVWQRDGGRCAKCGSQEKLEYDHIIPVSKGGSNTARNIQLLCESCNRLKSANIV
jgi:Holliday junction resolvasome RuvABC ATP-dependent DNA helicase subunit